jgi:hypothetical protein
MPRIKGLEGEQVGWVTRLLYGVIRRGLRRLTAKDVISEPVKIVAHHPALLRAVGRMELAQASARTVDPKLKHLAGLRASTLVGCPF